MGVRSTTEVNQATATAKVFGRNLNELMRVHPDLDSAPKLSKKCGVGTGTISRLRNGEVNATLDTIERLAKAFDVHPWQLLVPELDPKNPPALAPVSARERKLWEKLLKVAKELGQEID